MVGSLSGLRVGDPDGGLSPPLSGVVALETSLALAGGTECEADGEIKAKTTGFIGRNFKAI